MARRGKRRQAKTQPILDKVADDEAIKRRKRDPRSPPPPPVRKRAKKNRDEASEEQGGAALPIGGETLMLGDEQTAAIGEQRRGSEVPPVGAETSEERDAEVSEEEQPAAVASAFGEEFDRWATVSARLLRQDLAERARIIYDAGLESTWAQVDRRWFAALVEDIGAGRLERVQHYRELCFQYLEERAVTDGTVPSPLDRLEPEGLREGTAPGSETPALPPEALGDTPAPGQARAPANRSKPGVKAAGGDPA